MAETADLPEEIILNIFSRLPVKSLIRFTSVSKRLHFIILSDPKFAQSHLKAARRLSRRLLFFTDAPQLESLPLDDDADDTPSFGDPSSVRKLTLPFLHHCRSVLLMSSCNGLVFLICHVTYVRKLFYIWNPTLGFLKELPDPGFSSNKYNIWCYGAACLSPADDYKVLVISGYPCNDDVGWKFEVGMFSLRTHGWKRIESPHSWKRIESPGSHLVLQPLTYMGILSNGSLHWEVIDVHNIIVLLCFDLTEEVFRTMRLPRIRNDGKGYSKLGVCGGCLCVSRLPMLVCDSIDLWVMREYGVTDSWTMLFSLNLSDPFDRPLSPSQVLVSDSSMVVRYWIPGGYELIRIDRKEDNKRSHYMSKGRHCFMVERQSFMVEYEESLLWISGYQSVKETEEGQILETNHKASQS